MWSCISIIVLPEQVSAGLEVLHTAGLTCKRKRLNYIALTPMRSTPAPFSSLLYTPFRRSTSLDCKKGQQLELPPMRHVCKAKQGDIVAQGMSTTFFLMRFLRSCEGCVLTPQPNPLASRNSSENADLPDRRVTQASGRSAGHARHYAGLS